MDKLRAAVRKKFLAVLQKSKNIISIEKHKISINGGPKKTIFFPNFSLNTIRET